jgi:hypothetical protein
MVSVLMEPARVPVRLAVCQKCDVISPIPTSLARDVPKRGGYACLQLETDLIIGEPRTTAKYRFLRIASVDFPTEWESSPPEEVEHQVGSKAMDIIMVSTSAEGTTPRRLISISLPATRMGCLRALHTSH